MIETAIKEDLILDKKLIIPKNKLDTIRIMNELHPVVGGQPTHEKDQPNDNNPILDLACTLANIHASGVGDVADLRKIQNEPPSFFFEKGAMWGISSLKGNGILHVIGGWRDKSGLYAMMQFYYTTKEIVYRTAETEEKWGDWISVLTNESNIDYNKLLNVPITSTLSNDKTKISSIYAVNLVNTAASNAQKTANTAVANAKTADGKAVAAQSTANTAVTNAKTADGKAVAAQNTANIAVANAKTADGKAVAAQNTANTAVANAKTADGKAVAAQNTANTAVTNAKTADGKAVAAQNTANTAVANAKTADGKAVAADKKAVDAFKRVKPITEGGTGATTAANARKNLGHGDASTRNVATSLKSNGNTLVPVALSFGFGQEYKDVTAERAFGIPYKNNTQKPIYIMGSGKSNNIAAPITVDGFVVGRIGQGTSSYSFIVLPDSEYMFPKPGFSNFSCIEVS